MVDRFRTTLSLQFQLEDHRRLLVQETLFPRIDQAKLFVAHRQYEGRQGGGPLVRDEAMTLITPKGILETCSRLPPKDNGRDRQVLTTAPSVSASIHPNSRPIVDV